MDANGVNMHLGSLTMPAVQAFDKDTGTSLATIANDRLVAAIRKHPTRFAGLACFAPQAPRLQQKKWKEGSIRYN